MSDEPYPMRVSTIFPESKSTHPTALLQKLFACLSAIGGDIGEEVVVARILQNKVIYTNSKLLAESAKSIAELEAAGFEFEVVHEQN